MSRFLSLDELLNKKRTHVSEPTVAPVADEAHVADEAPVAPVADEAPVAPVADEAKPKKKGPKKAADAE